MRIREFDLNIEKVLENWTVAHAIREIIANALDEQILTATKDIEITKDSSGCWHIRDYGRGLQYIHLTQNENEEKLSHPKLIGKFGVGLKDALATFDRHKIGVTIDSRYGHITIGQSVKHGFSDITTLHAYISKPLKARFVGTEFVLTGCSDQDIEDAKKFFLAFSGLEMLESTEYGDVFEKQNGVSEIFINGIKVSEEDNFLFSYNITSLNAALKKALNRERTNVGRSAYSDRVRAIFLNLHSDKVIDTFTESLTRMSEGTQCDEMKWVDVQTHAVKLLHARRDSVFVTPEEIEASSGSILEVIRESGKQTVFVPGTVKARIENTTDINGNAISTIQTVLKDYNKSFEYEFVDYEKLKKREQKVFDLSVPTLAFFESRIKPDQIFITTKFSASEEDGTLGIYETENNRVIIHRSQLVSKEKFLGTLIHELTHADFFAADVSRYFEKCLTDRIGMLAVKVIRQTKRETEKV